MAVFPLRNMSTNSLNTTTNEVTPDGDETDKPPSSYHVALYEIIALYFSITFHIIDVILDVNVAVRYFYNGQFIYFTLTIAFIFIPALINTVFSITMYINDGQTQCISRRATKVKILCALILILQLAPILRYCQSLEYAKKCRQAEREHDLDNQKKYYELMLKEDSDVSLLRVIECFLEAAPQQILQITILLVDYGHGYSTIALIHNLGSIISSFVSMAWSLASYHRSIRFPQKSKLNISWTGTVLQFLWHILVTVSRILSISVLASVNYTYTTYGLVAHWMVMTLWISMSEKWYFCNNKQILDMLVQFIFGLVYIFTFISLSDGKTKWKYMFYYAICFAENMFAAFFWFFTADDRLLQTVYYQPLIYLTTIPFLVGIVIMILYYKWFHPTARYSSCKKISELRDDNIIVRL